MTKLLLGLLAAGKLGKVLLTGGTMIISVFAYALLYGWWYAVGFVLLIFVHEMGHFLAARQRGLAVGAPTFIPFVGAWIELKDLPPDWFYPVRESLGGALLRAGKATEAEQVFRADLAANPRNPRSLFGLMQSLKAQNRDHDAAFVEQQFKWSWKGADTVLRIEDL